MLNISSRKRSVFKEEILLQRENVQESATKPGENAAQGRNVHEMAPKRGEDALQEKNVPESTLKPGENTAAGRRGSTDATKNALPIREGVSY